MHETNTVLHLYKEWFPVIRRTIWGCRHTGRGSLTSSSCETPPSPWSPNTSSCRPTSPLPSNKTTRKSMPPSVLIPTLCASLPTNIFLSTQSFIAHLYSVFSMCSLERWHSEPFQVWVYIPLYCSASWHFHELMYVFLQCYKIHNYMHMECLSPDVHGQYYP